MGIKNIFIRFSHLSEQIFDHLENESLSKCRLISRIWCNYLDQQKIFHIRIIRSHIDRVDHQVGESWEKFFKVSNTENIIKIGIGVGNVYEGKVCSLGILNGLTPLHVAVYCKEYELCKYIIEKIGNERFEDAIGLTPLHSAALNGCLDLCILLNENLNYKNQGDNEGNTPLHWAAMGGHLYVYKYISGYLVNKNPRNSRGTTPLHEAAAFGYLDLVEEIFESVTNKNPKNNKGDTPLHMAAKAGDFQVFIYLTDNIREKT